MKHLLRATTQWFVLIYVAIHRLEISFRLGQTTQFVTLMKSSLNSENKLVPFGKKVSIIFCFLNCITKILGASLSSSVSKSTSQSLSLDKPFGKQSQTRGRNDASHRRPLAQSTSFQPRSIEASQASQGINIMLSWPQAAPTGESLGSRDRYSSISTASTYNPGGFPLDSPAHPANSAVPPEVWKQLESEQLQAQLQAQQAAIAEAFSLRDEDIYSIDLQDFIAKIQASPKMALDWLTRRQRMLMKRDLANISQ
jgi:hypothetical protein